MIDVGIKSLEACYRLPQSAAGNRHRLDAALDLLLDGLLDDELARLDLPVDGVLCLRAVYVPVRLKLSETVLGMAEAWAKAFAASVAETVRGRQTANAVWYRSKRELLLDLAVGIATGERQREWAWRQVLEYRGPGPLSEAEAARLWIAALIAEPTAIVPILVQLAEANVLEPLLHRLDPKQWTALANAAVERFAMGERKNTQTDSATYDDALPFAEVQRIVELSIILRTVPHSREIVFAMCRLAVIEVEPALASSARFHAVVEALVLRIHTSENARRERSEQPIRITPLAQRKVVVQDAGEDAKPTAARTRDDAILPALVTEPLRVWTEFGGLLFLLGVMDELAFPARLVEQVRVTGRSVRWLVHQLALKFVPAAADDAAALAFAGLMPNAVPPSVDEEPPSEDETAFLDQLREELENLVAERLGELVEAKGDPMGFLCRRRAEVVAERGWFELRFAPELVSTAIRRAALDLDPGFVPWLGVVVKFVYG